MMKNEKGVTLAVLVTTIIMLLILLGVGLQLTFTRVTTTIDARAETELGVIRQAISEKYEEAVAVNKDKAYANDASATEFFVGDMIDPADIFTISALSEYTTTNSNSRACLRAFTDYSHKVCTYKEDYYYYLDKTDLAALNVHDTSSEFIVNYKTGEVLNVTQKLDNDELLYLPPVYIEEDEKEDTGVFNDWAE